MAYEWNAVSKRDILDYDLIPFLCEPGAMLDLEEMEPFEPLMNEGPVASRIVSSVSLGLKGHASFGLGRQGGGFEGGYSFMTEVQERCQVLLDEWLRETGGGGVAQAGPTT